MAGIVKNRLKICHLFILMLLVAAMPLMIGVPASFSDETAVTGSTGGGEDTAVDGYTPEEAAEDGASSCPLTIITGNTEITSDVPVINKGGRIYLPVRFFSESLGYPVRYEKGAVYIGVRPQGSDMVKELTSLTGRKIKTTVKIGGIGYTNGYILGPGAFFEPHWNLDGRYQTVSFYFGIPDDQRGDAAEFVVKADDKTLARVKISKDDGLKEFNYNVKGAKQLMVCCTSGKGGALINPRAQ